MPSRTLATLSVLAAAVLVPAGVADAAAKYPTVKTIAPMTVSVGETMTVTGSGFVKGKGKNTVVFRRSGKRTIFAKADGLSSTRLSVVVPEKLRTTLATKSGKAVATKFQIRILAKRFGRGYTPLSKSPTVRAGASKAAPGTTPADATTAAAPATRTDAPAPPPPSNCDNDSQIDDVDSDDDNDLLSDTLEATLKTNRCLTDTDGDGMEDGWEYKSALDLNRESCAAAVYPTPCGAARPYPGKRNYPNPLDGSDDDTDYDGDWLTAGSEHRAWARKSPRTIGTMWYSDGLQASVDGSPADGCLGLIAPNPFNDAAYAGVNYRVYSLDRFGSKGGDGCLMDAERDEDGDFLTNVEETAGALSGRAYWKGAYKDEIQYRVVYLGTDWLDADSDGDGVVDGKDDQDYDDFWNVEEIVRGSGAGGLWVQPFNPCLPAVNSRTCPAAIPSDGGVWAPFSENGAPIALNWPLYEDDLGGAYTLWTPPVALVQSLPPVHPLPR